MQTLNYNLITNFEDEFSFLNNDFPCSIMYKGINYNSASHAFESSKLRDDKQKRCLAKLKYAVSLDVETPHWEERKLGIMKQILLIKFSNPSLKKLLLSTKNKTLIYLNTKNDTYWGNCYNEKENRYEGENHLGKLLMDIRDGYTSCDDLQQTISPNNNDLVFNRADGKEIMRITENGIVKIPQDMIKYQPNEIAKEVLECLNNSFLWG